MKKMLGLLALTVAVSSVATASQDFLKNINLDVQSRYRYQDLDTEGEKESDRARMGNEGFQKENRERTRFFKTVSGTVVLSDEAGVEADFKVEHRKETKRSGNTTLREKYRLKPSLNLRKDVKIGNFDTTWNLGYMGYTEDVRDPGQEKYSTSYNEFTFGPSFTVAGIDVDARALYLKDRKADEFEIGRNLNGRDTYEAWGINLDLANSNTIVSGKYGKVGYDVYLSNQFRDVNGKVYHKDGNGKANSTDVYFDYITSVRYTTPSFAGFTAFTGLENEWEKHTGTSGFYNTFDVVVGAHYNKSFETSVGKVTVSPYTKYSVLNRSTHYDRHNNDGDKRITVEKNEIRVGLKLALAVK